MGAVLAELPFTQAGFDRSDALRGDSEYLSRVWLGRDIGVVVVAGDVVLSRERGGELLGVFLWQELVSAGFLLPNEVIDDRLLFLGIDDSDKPIFGFCVDFEGASAGLSVSTADLVQQDGFEWQSLRQVGHVLLPQHAAWAATVAAMGHWVRRHRCCGLCGAVLQSRQGGWLRVCPADGSEHYPRTDAAVITSVVDPAGRMLLVRNVGWPPDRMAVVAGFVEPGESLEHAVRREVLEETGVRVGQVDYFASQPWPFPGSLMVGFQAVAETVEIAVDGVELAEAAWFSPDEYRSALADGRLRPGGPLSVSQRLIAQWLDDSL